MPSHARRAGLTCLRTFPTCERIEAKHGSAVTSAVARALAPVVAAATALVQEASFDEASFDKTSFDKTSVTEATCDVAASSGEIVHGKRESVPVLTRGHHAMAAPAHHELTS